MCGMLPHMATLDVALVTEAAMPDGWVDDHLLAGAIAQRGASVGFVCWDDPSVQWASVGIAVVRSTWDYFHRVDAFLAWADWVDQATRLINPAATLRWNAHKGYLLELAASGVPVVPTTLVRRGEHHVLAAGRWVIKPAVSAGANRTMRDPTQSDLDALAATTDVLVQPYLPSIEHGEVSVVCIDGEPRHAVRKVPSAGDYLSQEHLGATVTPIPIDAVHRELAHAALAAAPGSPAYARVDLLDHGDDAPVLMELELIEPTLWFEHGPATVAAFADLLTR
jgi:glutathione synthase/RimK-type ligase-like ATP-grasp enzyme